MNCCFLSTASSRCSRRFASSARSISGATDACRPARRARILLVLIVLGFFGALC
ncbi:MAG: hypothetical protein ACLVL7_08980 [Anaerotruncus massiliensis (ex Togo et al. 2019)]